MPDPCILCNEKSLFFIWTTSRVLDTERLFKIREFARENKKRILTEGAVVCQSCAHKHNLIR